MLRLRAGARVLGARSAQGLARAGLRRGGPWSRAHADHERLRDGRADPRARTIKEHADYFLTAEDGTAAELKKGIGSGASTTSSSRSTRAYLALEGHVLRRARKTVPSWNGQAALRG